ncbi:MAG: 16S rRNA (cytosine(1402)-N(4))-methyltransferase RsmH [Chlamydiae bacterium]|nr:16S rRNA (cytosine(1402)-N(4))-methyltransferase RsmH [Chlamydiota bacterium]
MTQNDNKPHVSVMLDETLENFKDVPLNVFVEGTLGAGGHAKMILESHPEIQRYIGFDQDQEAIQIARSVLAPWADKVEYVNANFSEMDEYLKKMGVKEVNGFFFDLGVSSMQFDNDYKGFSFSKEGPLDMRMNAQQSLTAKDIVNKCSEEELGRIFREFGEEPRWRQAAKLIVEYRKKRPLETTKELSELICSMYKGRGKIHPATLIFQGLRIAVNRELDVLSKGLHSALSWLAPRGRIGVISFHSLEDRIVKNVFRDAASPVRDGKIKIPAKMRLVTKKPLVPTLKETKQNPRARSAKLRFIEKWEQNCE